MAKGKARLYRTEPIEIDPSEVGIPIQCCNKKGYLMGGDGDGVYTTAIKYKRGTVQKGLMPCIKTSLDSGVIVMEDKQFRVRKLTPKECWRLMGFSDESFEKAERVNSNTQLYKQAGNSIVVDVLFHIFKGLLDE